MVWRTTLVAVLCFSVGLIVGLALTGRAPDPGQHAAAVARRDGGRPAEDRPTPLPSVPAPAVALGCPQGLLLGGASKKLVPGRDPFLEERMQWLLEDYDVPEGAVAVVDPVSGELLAAAGCSDPDHRDRELIVDPRFPAASVFKIVSSSALLEHGVTPEDSVCYHGGLRSVNLGELRDNPRTDSSCASLGTALARSLNVPFAKWADRRLKPQILRQVSARFGLHPPREDVEARCFGTAQIPDDRLAFTRTAAGFGEVRLSVWHGAQLAAIVANRGLAPQRLRARGFDERILSSAHAEALTGMLARTIKEGTARRAFHENGRYLLEEFSAAGKTGSLVEGEGEEWGEVTWFVGFAPIDEPRVAVAAVLVNTPYWRIRASYVGREALRTALLRSNPYRPTKDRRVAKQTRHHRRRRSR